MCDTKGKVHQTETDFRFSQKSAQDEDSQNYHLLANKVSNHKCIHAWKTIANIGPAHISDQHEVHFGQQQWHFYSAPDGSCIPAATMAVRSKRIQAVPNSTIADDNVWYAENLNPNV
jgi:hypothetical protein